MKANTVVKSIIYNKYLNRILLIRRSQKDPVGTNTWENAEGNIKDGENPEDAIKREIAEETGIADIQVKKVAYVTLINGNMPYLIIAYLC